jgi:glycosyltransferase involved in cell wall biosynthesis
MNVSVVVVTYNSSNTIIETLESILHQSFDSKNIELIISDDASKDDTVKVIKKWLLVNSSDFSRVAFIKNITNNGVSKNCNNAWKAATFEWIKSIAGDDILKPNCLKDNVGYISKNPNCKILFSKMEWFGSIKKITPSPYDLKFFKKDCKGQNKWLRFFSFNIAPTSFINRSALIDVGYANENYRQIEDMPLWIKFTLAGYKLHFLDCVTVNYRVGNSITMSTSKHANFDFLNELIFINKKQASSFWLNPIDEIIRLEQLFLYKSNIFIGKIFKNKKNFFTARARHIPWFFMPIHSLRTLWIKSYNCIVSIFLK